MAIKDLVRGGYASSIARLVMRGFSFGVAAPASIVPVTQTNRCGFYIVAGGSGTNALLGNVNTNLIDLTETWADVINNSQVTTAIDDGVRACHIRCPRGVWPTTQGGSGEFFNHCVNGNPIYVPGPFHALHVAESRAGGVRLTQGYGTFLAYLNSQGCAITSYNNGLPNNVASGGAVLGDWESDPLLQGNGYPTLSDVTNLTYLRTMYADELDNGCTEFAFDGTGGDESAGMLSNTLFPMLATAGTYSGTGTFTNGYDRKVCVEAAPPVGSWESPYTFCARYDSFVSREASQAYLHSADMGSVAGCFIQSYHQADYDHALALLTAGYRVWVKWEAMKATVGSTAMAALLAAGETADGGGEELPPSISGRDRWLKLNANTRGWARRSCGWTRRPW